MIDGLHPYPKMKESGLPWLGQVPAHWDIAALRHHYDQCLGKMLDSKRITGAQLLPYLRNVDVQWDRINVHGLPTMDIFPDEYERHTVSPGDLLVCEGGEVGRAAIWTGQIERCAFQKALHRLRPWSRERDDPSFLRLQFRLAVVAGAFLDGHESTIAHLTGEKLRAHRFVFPPVDEQRLIVRFLDWQGGQISRLIRAKLNLLRLVAEEREVLTNDAIRSPGTRQARLGVVADQIFRWIHREETALYMPIGLFNRGRGIFHKQPTSGKDLGDSTFSWIEQGDLILSGQFAWEGAVAIASPDDARCICSHRYHILRARPDIAQVSYLSSFLRTSFGHLLLNEHSRGAAGRNRPLNINTLLKEKIPVPPLGEQGRLAKLVELETQLIAAIKSTSDGLREYRDRLIADVVTGNLDVRAVAASLPDDLEPVDEAMEEENFDEEAMDEADTEDVAA